MENPADVYTTGIPMSEKGNFDHNKYGCGDGDTLDNVSVLQLSDHDYPNNSHILLRDSTGDNAEFINNSIQDGFQSEILCSFESEAGLQPDLPITENSTMEIESVSESDTHINFSDSPGTSFGKIESFSSMEGLVSSLDEQLDNYILSGFKSENKHSSDDEQQSLENEQRNVTEAICDIAKSFGFEDLLPDTFQVDGSKDGFCVTVSTDDLCNGDTENIGELSLEDFEKCPDLHSPGSSLNLVEHLCEESYVFDGLEMISPKLKAYDNSVSPKLPQLLKGDDNKNLLNDKDLISNNEGISSDVKVLLENKSDDLEDNKSSDLSDVNSSFPSVSNADGSALENVSEIPIVSISDIQCENAFSNVDNNSPPAGTVVITTDKDSKKMQIVLTLEQGQQIYDIDTVGIDAGQQPIDLDVSGSVCDELPNEQKSIPNSDITTVEKIVISSVFSATQEKTSQLPEKKEVTEQSPLIDYIPNVPSKGKKNKIWICPVEGCGQVLDKECKLRVHMISHKGARPFKCTFEGCDWAFTTPYRLRRHVETHLGSKDFVCDFEGCNRKFTTVYNLKTHKKRHKWPNSLTCPSKDCKMSFANRRKLEMHLKVHEDVEAPYKCSICGKQYYSANCIASHYRTHQYNEDDFKCPFQGCGKVYDKICRLRQHIRHHTGDRPYACPAEGCKWSFMSASKLTRHMRKHTGERKFVCTEPGCGKSFMRPEHLKGHIVIHSGDKPFHCPHENCNARFTAKSSLYVHVKKHCPSVLKVVYPCPVQSCVKKYNSKATLKQHLQKLHPETMQNGKSIDIAEKLELIMPVSVVNPSENALELMNIDELVTDDPTADLQIELLQTPDQSLNILSSSVLNSESTNPELADSSKVVTKAAKQPSVQPVKESTKSVRTKEVVISSKLTHANRSGCARTDYCFKVLPKKPEIQTNYFYLNQNSNDNSESKNFLLNNNLISDVKSPDVMLTSSIIYDNLSEQLIKSNFSPDNSSVSHSLYQDDSILINSSTFGHELIPVSLLSDGVESDESGTGIVFSEHNCVDAFTDAIHLHGLD